MPQAFGNPKESSRKGSCKPPTLDRAEAVEPPTALPAQFAARVFSMENYAETVSLHIAASSSTEEEPDPIIR